MCMFKSMLLLKDKVFCPNYDSHEDMINETGMEHGPMRENFVRVEITPPDDEMKFIKKMNCFTGATALAKSTCRVMGTLLYIIQKSFRLVILSFMRNIKWKRMTAIVM